MSAVFRQPVKTIVLAHLLMLTHRQMAAQLLQTEIFGGHDRITLTTSMLNSLERTEKYYFSGTFFFYQHYKEDHAFLNEAGIMAYVYRRLNKNILIGPGVYFNSIAGFQKRISMLYSFAAGQISGFVMPTLGYYDAGLGGELMCQLRWEKTLRPPVAMFAQAQLSTSQARFSFHGRSLQQIRLGLRRNELRFGAAVDFDQYGTKPVTNHTIGLFVRKNFQ